MPAAGEGGDVAGSLDPVDEDEAFWNRRRVVCQLATGDLACACGLSIRNFEDQCDFKNFFGVFNAAYNQPDSA
jgi:hypothetical protein